MVKILDLGLALLSSAGAPAELTSTGQVMGTIDSMAPEQLNDAHRVGYAADIYSLGATLFKLLTGASVYHGSRYTTLPQKLNGLMHDSPPPLETLRPELSPELSALVARLLARRPEDRPATAREAARLLAPFAAGHHLPALLAQVSAGPEEPLQSLEAATLPRGVDSSLPQPLVPQKPGRPKSKGGRVRVSRTKSHGAAKRGDWKRVRVRRGGKHERFRVGDR